MRENAIAYVSGFLLMKSFKLHSCLKCTNALSSTELDDSRKLFCHFKAFDEKKSDLGGLQSPSSPYLEYIIKLEDTFIKTFSVYTKSEGVGRSILDTVKSIPKEFDCCTEFPFEFLQKLFVRMRIYYAIKFANRIFATTKKKDRKYIKVTHLWGLCAYNFLSFIKLNWKQKLFISQ